MRTSEQINEVAAAMAAAQADIKPATKDAVNPAYKSKYADLTAIWDAIRGPLSKQKIAVWQEAELTEAGVAVTTRLAHASGQWVEFGPLTVPCGKRDAHGVGSATSYAKRYAIAAAVGVVAEDDDDGNSAVQGTKPAAVATPKPEGFDKFLEGLRDVTVEGSDALKAVWVKARPEYRQYLTKVDPALWETLKAKAEKATGVPA